MPPTLTADIARHRRRLAPLPWVASTIDAIRALHLTRFVCYGLGSIFGSRNAQWQLALALAIRDRALDDGVLLEVYDPALAVKEYDYLRDEFACVEAPPPFRFEQSALLYMPHCPQEVYADVLAANEGQLHRIVVLGNSFQSYARRRLDLHPAISNVVDIVDEVPCLIQDDDLERAFNDTSLLRFRQTLLAGER